MKEKFSRILISEEEIAKRVAELAEEISRFYKNLAAEEIVVICILRGAVIFMSDLVRQITDIPLVLDFMAISSYGSSTKSNGTVRIIKDASEDLSGRHVLIVEDIIDSGYTLESLKKVLKSKNCKSVHLCTFCNKPSRRKVDVEIDFCGFEVPDEFIVGYGLDYSGLYRELPHVAIIAPSLYGRGNSE